ncbi:phosphoribosylaminoimidazolesuccinocarboxamide synthase [Enterococcus italicus]|uniref:phosphoribosylaminoimidazolesuccinocarboxamide synthase n=1 Tax=Enterococcus italicus TaxID=246144 RepID=UPI003FA307F8
MNTCDVIYEGKAKKMYRTEDESIVLVEYLDQVTALNGARKDEMVGKAELNNTISSFIFTWLKKNGIENHFVSKEGKTEQLIKKLEMIPLEIVLRNVAGGSFSKRFAVAQGTVLTRPIIEFYYKADELDDPFINDAHVDYFSIATEGELKSIRQLTLMLNEKLIELFDQIDLTLVDFKIEVGRTSDGKILLADEISPDTCRLWDKTSKQSLDKDVYRKKTGDLLTVYREVTNRLDALKEEN